MKIKNFYYIGKDRNLRHKNDEEMFYLIFNKDITTLNARFMTKMLINF